LVVGPTSAPFEDLADDVEVDLERLRRSGLEVSYRCTGAGPRAVRNGADVIAAAPFVVRAVVAAARDGFAAVIVDCTDDPGVEAARDRVAIPVIGAGEGLRMAIERSPGPVQLFSGDELRTMAAGELVERARGAATVALGATGCSHLVELFAAVDGVRVVIDPLDAALECCLAAMDERTDVVRESPDGHDWEPAE
jgi:Asp/Glu/hydantoin racemase